MPMQLVETQKNFTRKQVEEMLRHAYYALQHLCNGSNNWSVPWWFHHMESEISRQEKEHMKFGERLLDRKPSRKTSHQTRVQYFVVRAMVFNPQKVKSAVDAVSLRSDYLYRAALRETLGLPAIRKALKARGLNLSDLEQIDYVKHLAGR